MKKTLTTTMVKARTKCDDIGQVKNLKEENEQLIFMLNDNDGHHKLALESKIAQYQTMYKE